MAEEEKTQDEGEANRPSVFYIHNSTRGRNNRTLRANQPVHHKLKQYLGGGQYRSIRGRPIVLPEEEFQRLLPEIKEKAAAGIFEVKTPDGRVIDLESLAPALPMPVSPPLPNPPLDSIARDTQGVGQEMPPYPGGTMGLPEGEIPSLVSGADPETTPGDPPDVPPPPPPAPSKPKESSDVRKKKESNK